MPNWSQTLCARRRVAAALRTQDSDAQTLARQGVDAAKHGLGERGAVWWDMARPITTDAWRAIRRMLVGMQSKHSNLGPSDWGV